MVKPMTGRPRKEIPVADVFDAAAKGYNLTQIAALLGVSRDTLERRMKHRDYAAAYERGRGMAQGKVIDLIWVHAEANFKAAAFLANNLLGWSSTRRIESDTEQTRFVVEIPAPMSQEQWLATFGHRKPPPIGQLTASVEVLEAALEECKEPRPRRVGKSGLIVKE